MKVIFYNPANDGFAAKAWECLRRNPIFRQLVTDALAVPREQRAAVWAMVARDSNALAGAAFGFLLPISEQGRPLAPKVTIDTTWPKAPAEFREHLEWSLGNLPMPVDVPTPPFKAMQNLRDPKVRQAVEMWARLAAAQWEQFDAIGLPKFVRDQTHALKIRAEVGRRVRIPMANTRFFGDTGSALGAHRQWDAYLFVEANHASLGLDGAERAAAMYVFGKSMKGRIRKEVKDFAIKQRSQLKTYVTAIERAITSTYPTFIVAAPKR